MSKIILPGSSEDMSVKKVPDFMLSLNSGNSLTSIDNLSLIARAGFHLAELGAGKGEIADPAKLTGLALANTRKALRENEVNAKAVRSDIAVGSYSANMKNEVRDNLKKMIELSETISAPVLTVKAGSISESNEVEKYALDLIYDLESSLNESGVKLAFRCAGDNSSFLCNPENLYNFRKEAPGCVGFAISDSDLAIAGLRDNVALLAENADISTLSSTKSENKRCVLQNRTDAEFLLKGFAKNDFAGSVALNPIIRNIDYASLSELYKIALDFVPECFIQ